MYTLLGSFYLFLVFGDMVSQVMIIFQKFPKNDWCKLILTRLAVFALWLPKINVQTDIGSGVVACECHIHAVRWVRIGISMWDELISCPNGLMCCSRINNFAELSKRWAYSSHFLWNWTQDTKNNNYSND